MEAKLASMGLKSPASPVVRQFARQSLNASDAYLSPSSAADASRASPPSPVAEDGAGGPAASTLANQRAKLKANSRTSAPANLHLNVANPTSLADKSPLWSEKETLLERRSPSPNARPRSTGPDSNGQLTDPSHTRTRMHDS